MNNKLKRFFSVAFLISVIVTAIPAPAYAYGLVWENCATSDCSAPIVGAMVPGSSRFPYATSNQHCRIATYRFICDNCGYAWVSTITTNETHEYNLSGKCECGHRLQRLMGDDDCEE